MIRSGYSDDEECFPNQFRLWAANVRRSIRGKRGQAFLRELADALDAMPTKELVRGYAITADKSCCCALGCVALRRGVDVSPIVPEPDGIDDGYDGDPDGDWSTEWLRDELGIPDALAREIAYQNDDGGPDIDETPAERWTRMRAWVARRITPSAGATA